jgi:hypothetical protein
LANWQYILKKILPIVNRLKNQHFLVSPGVAPACHTRISLPPETSPKFSTQDFWGAQKLYNPPCPPLEKGEELAGITQDYPFKSPLLKGRFREISKAFTF